MRRFRPFVVLMLAAGAAFSARDLAADPSGGDGPSLEDELARLKAEIQRGTPTDDPFAQGRVPDVVVLSVTDVAGEVAPCG